MHFNLTDYLLWLASPLFQVGVLVALFRRGLHKEYRYFYNYTILVALGQAFLLCVRKDYPLYYYGYWVSMAISTVLTFAVLCEMFKNALRPYETLRHFSVVLFRWLAFVVLGGGIWAATLHADRLDSITEAILLAHGSVRLMLCGLGFFLLLFSEYLGISRRHMSFGIALGFSWFSSMSVLVSMGMSHPSIVPILVLRRINLAAYDVAALIWLGYTVLPSQTGTIAAERLRDWNSALENVYLSRIARNPLTIKFIGK